jgi:FkbM family methyltransferase
MAFNDRLRVNAAARASREWIARIVRLGESPFKAIVREIDQANVSAVLDVGANIGQFGIDIRRYGFKGQIVSYEPVQETFSSLTQTKAKYPPWDAIQLGLGAVESTEVINVSANSGLSSSLLPMNSVHVENFPNSATISTEDIDVSTIDLQLIKLGISPESVLLKLDVQGFEANVLRGAACSLSRIPVCFLEVSILPLYEGELTILPILNLLQESGHEVIDIFRGIKAKDGQLLQLDILTKLSKR